MSLAATLQRSARSWRQSLQEWRGIAYALRFSYGDRDLQRRMVPFYGQFLGPADLAFDIGANAGNRIRAWSQIGARVIAVEPQPALIRTLRLLYGHNPNVVLVPQAVGARPGSAQMLLCRREPTVSTLSRSWIAAVKHMPSFAGVRWDASLTVPVTTLDALVERFGEPAFCKIDTEGSELEVLQGLSRPLRALSFEYLSVAVDRALACVERLMRLGAYEFNPSQAESMRLEFPSWIEPDRLCAWLRQRSLSDPVGDVYARLMRAG